MRLPISTIKLAYHKAELPLFLDNEVALVQGPGRLHRSRPQPKKWQEESVDDPLKWFGILFLTKHPSLKLKRRNCKHICLKTKGGLGSVVMAGRPSASLDTSNVLRKYVKSGIHTGTLHLEHKKLQAFPQELVNLDTSEKMMIKEMLLEENFLTLLPNELGEFFKLYELRLMNNHLTCLPQSISMLTNLQLLYLRKNFLRDLPAEIGHCRALTILQLSENPIIELPAEICLLTKLRNLQLDNMLQLSNPPPDIRDKGLKAMQHFLRAYHKARRSLTLEMKEFGLVSMPSIAALQGLTSLVLMSNRLQFLGPKIIRSYDLMEIDLSDNDFELFPIEVVCFKHLTSLDLSFNKIEVLPLDFRSMTLIKKLIISHNNLREIPLCIGLLQDMWLFQCDDNFVDFLPNDMFRCRSLTELNLSSNRLQTIPNDIVLLSKLCKLEAACNLITSLPISIGKMTMLATLDISNNCLGRLPRQLGILSKTLEFFLFLGNDLKSPSREIRINGAKACLVHMQLML
jgi:leucine-rich repeat protein SHOC2